MVRTYSILLLLSCGCFFLDRFSISHDYGVVLVLQRFAQDYSEGTMFTMLATGNSNAQMVFALSLSAVSSSLALLSSAVSHICVLRAFQEILGNEDHQDLMETQ